MLYQLSYEPLPWAAEMAGWRRAEHSLWPSGVNLFCLQNSAWPVLALVEGRRAGQIEACQTHAKCLGRGGAGQRADHDLSLSLLVSCQKGRGAQQQYPCAFQYRGLGRVSLWGRDQLADRNALHRQVRGTRSRTRSRRLRGESWRHGLVGNVLGNTFEKWRVLDPDRSALDLVDFAASLGDRCREKRTIYIAVDGQGFDEQGKTVLDGRKAPNGCAAVVVHEVEARLECPIFGRDACVFVSKGNKLPAHLVQAGPLKSGGVQTVERLGRQKGRDVGAKYRGGTADQGGDAPARHFAVVGEIGKPLEIGQLLVSRPPANQIKPHTSGANVTDRLHAALLWCNTVLP